VYYPHPALMEPDGARLVPALGALALLAALTAGAWLVRKRLPWLLTGWLWFLGLLVPMIGLVQVGTLAHADRYVYLAGIGLELALAWSLRALALARPALRGAAVGAALAALAALAATTWRQTSHWRDSRALLEHALAVTERNHVAHNLLGLLDARAGDSDAALVHFREATADWPLFFEGWLNVGLACYQRDDLVPARTALETALDLEPRSREARLCLAATQARLGRRAEARALLDEGVRLDPGLADEPNYRELRRGLGGD